MDVAKGLLCRLFLSMGDKASSQVSTSPNQDMQLLDSPFRRKILFVPTNFKSVIQTPHSKKLERYI